MVVVVVGMVVALGVVDCLLELEGRGVVALGQVDRSESRGVLSPREVVMGVVEV